MTNDKLRAALEAISNLYRRQDVTDEDKAGTMADIARAALAAPVEAEPVAQEALDLTRLVFANSNMRARINEIYLAGRWDCATLDSAEQVRLWTRLRDAAGIAEGTATAAGVAAHPAEQGKDAEYSDPVGSSCAVCRGEVLCPDHQQGKDAEDAIPREPTEAMLIAGCDAHYRTSTMDHVGPVLAKCWRAMFDAARNAKPAKGG